MKLGRRGSSNINDSRRSGGAGGGGGRLVGGGIGGIIVVVIIFLITGNPGVLLEGLGGAVGTPPRSEYTESAQDQHLYEVLSVALADTEDVWNGLFPEYGKEYKEPTLEIYHETVRSGCGIANSGMGPFYCPADQKVYVDLSFYNDLTNRFGADQGDYTMAYVLAHEVGHHVQTLMGVTEQFHSLQGRVSQTEYNRYSVRFELQADYLAGVVAHYQQRQGYLDPGDIQEAMSAAESIGDDAIQEQVQGYVTPDTFNHGTSDQRMRWFQKGYEAGDLSEWDTFAVPESQL